MESLRFIHAADLHLDSPFRGIAEASAAVRDQLQSATLHALSRVVDHTIHSKADFLIIAGDIYDSKDRNLRALGQEWVLWKAIPIADPPSPPRNALIGGGAARATLLPPRPSPPR